MLREVEEAVQSRFRVEAEGADSRGMASDWESRLHISQVWHNSRYIRNICLESRLIEWQQFPNSSQ